MVSAPYCTGAGHCPVESQEAERELSSFYQAVLEMYGPEEAIRVSEYWIEELERAVCIEKRVSWRRISIEAAARLAAQPSRRRSNGASVLDCENATKKLCRALA
jgi:hypothetical protein